MVAVQKLVKPSFIRFTASFRDRKGAESWREVPYVYHPAAVRLFEIPGEGHYVPRNTPYSTAILGAVLGAGVAWILVFIFKMDADVTWAACIGGGVLGMFSPFLAILWARRWYLFPDERERFKTESREGKAHF